MHAYIHAYLGGALMRLSGSCTGCLRGSSLFNTPAPVRAVKIVLVPVKSKGSRPGTVLNWPKYPYLLAVRGMGVIVKAP